MKKYAIIGLCVIAAAAAGFFAWRQWMRPDDAALRNAIADQPAMVDLYARAKSAEERMAADPDAAAAYVEAGLRWKSIAEQMSGDAAAREPFFRRAMQVYDKGIERFGQKNILFFLNAGNVAERIGEYERAEKYFKQAILRGPADESGYVELVELYSFHIKKEKEEVLAVIEDGMKRMVNTAPLIASRATYLRRVGDLSAALADYEILAEAYPDAGFKNIVAELKEQLR